MKKIILSVVFANVIALGAYAQGLYVGAGFGYGFRAGSTVTGAHSHSNGSVEVVKGSYGEGMTPNISVGLLRNNIGVELNMGYLIGTGRTIKDDFGNNRGTVDRKATSFYLNPSLVIRGNDEWKLVPYARMGVFLGLANLGKDKRLAEQYTNAGMLLGTNETELEYKGGIATGLTSALGVDFMVTDKLAIFGEVNGRLASWAPKSYTSSSTAVIYLNGVPQSTLQTSVSGNFEKEIPDNYAGTDLTTQILAFSSIGFNVGVKWYINK